MDDGGGDDDALNRYIHIYFREIRLGLEHTHTHARMYARTFRWRPCASCFLLLQRLTSTDLDIGTRKWRHVHGDAFLFHPFFTSRLSSLLSRTKAKQRSENGELVTWFCATALKSPSR